jgi:glycosyltransferase involved in cell wall biosynthesis
MDGVKEATTGMGGWMNKEVGTQKRVLVDLHLLSRASGTASNWWVRGLGAGAEAQASGLPAVVCGIGGPRECIQPGVSGFVVGFANDEEFFARVELLLDDAVARQNMGRAAREFAEGMRWESVLEGLIELHSRLAGIRPDYSEVYARS